MSVECLELDDALAETRAQVEEARRERDDALERARISDQCRLANEAEMRRADVRIGLVRTALTNACDFAAQALLKEKALAAEKSALASRVAVLEEALRGLSSDLDRVLAMRSTPGRTEWLTTIAEKARRALEVEP